MHPRHGVLAVVLSMRAVLPVKAVELERTDAFGSVSRAMVRPAPGAPVTETDTDTDTVQDPVSATTIAATGGLATSGSRSAGRADRGALNTNAQFSDEVFSSDIFGPVSISRSMTSSVIAIPDAGDLAQLVLFGGLGATGGSLRTDVEVDFVLPPTLLEFTDNVERVIFGLTGCGAVEPAAVHGGPLTATVHARLIGLLQDHIGLPPSAACLPTLCTTPLEYEATLTGDYTTDADAALRAVRLSGDGVGTAARDAFLEGIVVSEHADADGFQRTVTAELPALAGDLLFKDVRTEFGGSGSGSDTGLRKGTDRVALYYELTAAVDGFGAGTAVIAAINDPLFISPTEQVSGDLFVATATDSTVAPLSGGSASGVTEPAGMVLLGAGLLATPGIVALFARRRRQA